MQRQSTSLSLPVLLALVIWVSPAAALSRTIPVPNQPGAASAQEGIEGLWGGTLDVGVKLRLVLRISRTADGKLKATVDSLDQSATDLPVDTISFQDGILKFEMKRLFASYVGTLSKTARN